MAESGFTWPLFTDVCRISIDGANGRAPPGVRLVTTAVQSPENLRVTVPDQWLHVVALHPVLVAAEMARKHAPSAA